eukprot:TRINITY_DN64640_c0_g1_i1.p1 TRINITY_DN64640_c0_g1~~TRINITY_DN64640_c0_g1_i1.p1  ORF type:complete len:357 (+),score=26.50 TRINITY_DN64640_c0_g1_i1:64-1134(+)
MCRRRHHTFLYCVLLSITSFRRHAAVATADAPSCTGIFNQTAVVDLCHSNWPGPRKDRYTLWLVLFHAPWCGHCQEIEPMYIRLAQRLASESGIAIGAIDCSILEHHSVCRRHEIAGYPTFKASLAGKVVGHYDGDREADALRTWLLGVLRRKGGSARCPLGRVNGGGVVVPLCMAHFPDSGSSHSWLVAYYDNFDDRMVGSLNGLAQAAGNLSGTLRGKRSDRASGASGLTWQEQLQHLSEHFGLQLALPKGAAPGTKKPLAKVGAVCCDCDGMGDFESSDYFRFCDVAVKRPALAWFGHGSDAARELIPPGRDAAAAMASPRRLIELSLEAFGAYKPRRSGGRRPRRASSDVEL